MNGRLFTEEYQMAFMKTYGEVFDSLSYIMGEHVWVFADFATAENVKRVDGNKKEFLQETGDLKWQHIF